MLRGKTKLDSWPACGTTDKIKMRRLARMVFELLSHEEIKAEPEWGSREGEGMAGRTV